MQSKKKIDDLLKRLNTLEQSNIKITLDFIRDLEHNKLAFRVSAVNRLGVVIEQDTFIDIPKPYLEKYFKKYNVSCSGGKTYDVINDELVEVKNI